MKLTHRQILVKLLRRKNQHKISKPPDKGKTHLKENSFWIININFGKPEDNGETSFSSEENNWKCRLLYWRKIFYKKWR